LLNYFSDILHPDLGEIAIAIAGGQRNLSRRSRTRPSRILPAADDNYVSERKAIARRFRRKYNSDIHKRTCASRPSTPLI
jgi:hypothetical protein